MRNTGLLARCLLFLLTHIAAAAGLLDRLPASRVSDSTHPNIPLTTPPPNIRIVQDLRKRQAQNTKTRCGYISGETWNCYDTNAYCAATIFQNGDAYQYCSTSGAAQQNVVTTVYSSWPSGKVCPITNGCCYAPSPAVVTAHFIASGYTVTGFECWSESLSLLTVIADTNVINPSSFSASLLQATATSSSTSAGSGPTDGSSISGLSSGAKSGIGAGVGGGVGIILICGIAFCCWRVHEKRKERRLAEVARSRQGQYSERMSYNPSGQGQYYQPQQQQQQQAMWSPQPVSSPGDYTQSTEYPKELQANVVERQELPGQVSAWNYK